MYAKKCLNSLRDFVRSFKTLVSLHLLKDLLHLGRFYKFDASREKTSLDLHLSSC